jgi:hypothetical protein
LSVCIKKRDLLINFIKKRYGINSNSLKTNRFAMLKSISLALVINIGLFTHHIYAATHAVILGGSSGI